MMRSHRRENLSPGEMFPAGDPAYRVSFPRLRSGLKVRVVERGDPESAPVVLVHGLGATMGQNWGYMAPLLAANVERLLAQR